MDPKFLRRQIRNVLQEHAELILKSEVGEGVKKEVTALINTRLDSIEKFVHKFLGDQDRRAKNIQGFLISEVKNKIQKDIFDNMVTIQAAVEVLSEAGLGIENFGEKIKAKKPEIEASLIKQAGEAMEAEAKARAEAESAKTEAAQPVAASSIEQSAVSPTS